MSENMKTIESARPVERPQLRTDQGGAGESIGCGSSSAGGGLGGSFWKVSSGGDGEASVVD